MPVALRICLLAAWSSLCAFAQDPKTVSLEELTAYSAPPRADIPLDEEAARLLGEARQALQDDRPLAAYQILNTLRNGPAGASFDVNLALARVGDSFGFLEEARDAAEAAVQVRPDDVRANLLLARILLASEDADATASEQARLHLVKATRASDKQASLAEATHAWLLLGQLLQQQGYDQAALEAWHTFDLAIWETFPEHRNYEAIATFLSGNPRGGFASRRALLKRMDDSDGLLALLEEVLRREPRNAELSRMKLLYLRESGRFAEAFQLAKTQLQQGDTAAILPTALTAAIEAGQLEAWVEEVLRDLERPSQRRLARAMLRSLNQRGKSEMAGRMARALVAEDPGDVEASIGLFAAEVDADRTEEALELLLRMLRAKPDLDLAPRYREVLLTRCGKLPSPTADVADYATTFVRGLQAQHKGDTPAAEEAFETVRTLQPTFGPAYIETGQQLLDTYQWDACLELAERYREAARRHAGVAFLNARALAGLDRNDEAEEAFRKAIERDAREPAYSLALGDHCRRLNEQRCAQRFYRESFLLEGSDRAFEGLIEAYLRDGKRAVAEAEADRLAEDVLSADARRRVETMIRYLDKPFSKTHLDTLAAQMKEHPDDVLTIRMYAAGLYANRIAAGGLAPDAAVGWIAYAHELDPDDEELALEAAQMFRLQTRFTQAADILAPLVKRYPNRKRLLRDYSTTLLAAFEWSRGLDVMQRLVMLEDGPDQSARQAQLLVLCFEAGQFERVGALLEQIEADGQRDVTDTHIDYLNALNRHGDAYALARRAWGDAPADPRRRTLLYNEAMRMDDFDQLEKWVNNWLVGAEDPITYVEMLVRLRIARKDYDGAREAADTLKDGGLDEAIIRRILLGQIASQAGQRELAAREFEALLNERTVSEQQKRYIWGVWIDGLVQMGAFDEALEVCDRWQRSGLYSRIDLRNARMTVLQSAGRDAEQIPLLEERLQDNIRGGAFDVGAYNDLGYTLADQNRDLHRCEERIRYAVAIEPLNAAYLDSMGWVAYKLGRFAEARYWLEHAIQLRNGRIDATMFDHLGDVHWRLHDFDEAVVAWECAAHLLDQNEQLSPRDLRLRQGLRRKLRAAAEGKQPAIATVGEAE